MRTEYGEFPHLVTAILADWSSTQSGLGPCSKSKRHLEMSLSCCSQRRNQTRHASAVRLSFLLFSAERFSPSKNTPLEVSIAAATTSLPCCTCLPLYAYADPEISSSSLPLVTPPFPSVFACLVRLGRSNFSCPFPNLSQRSSRASVVVLSPAFFASSLCLIIWAIALLVIDAYYVS